MERGAVSKGRDIKTGENIFPKLELVRITIPRRVYTNTQMEYTAESISGLFKERDKIFCLCFKGALAPVDEMTQNCTGE